MAETPVADMRLKWIHGTAPGEEDRPEEARRARAPRRAEDVHGEDARDSGQDRPETEADLGRPGEEEARHLGQEADDGHGHEPGLEDALEAAVEELERGDGRVDEVEVDVRRDVDEVREVRHARGRERHEDGPVRARRFAEVQPPAEGCGDHAEDEDVERGPQARRVRLELRGAEAVEDRHSGREKDGAAEEREEEAPVLGRRREDRLPVRVLPPRRHAVPHGRGEREAEAGEERDVALGWKSGASSCTPRHERKIAAA